MNRNKQLERWYVKYIVKSPCIFLTYLLVSILLFLLLTLSIQMENGQTLLYHILIEAGTGL